MKAYKRTSDERKDKMTDRHIEVHTVREIGENSIEYDSGVGHGLFDEMRGVVEVGDEIELETRGLSLITGVRRDGVWLFRKTDEDLDREHREVIERNQRQREDLLDKMRDEWQARTDALPDWVRVRIDKFAESPLFERDGWGYELTVAELAVMYAELDEPDMYSTTPAIDEYAEREGTSGNQHGCAAALAKMHLRGESLAGTVSALTPLTGAPYYEEH